MASTCSHMTGTLKHELVIFTMQRAKRESIDRENTYDLTWRARISGSMRLLFLTNEFIIFLQSGKNKYPTIMQYTLLDKDLSINRDFRSSQGLVQCHTNIDTNPLQICECAGSVPVLSGIIDASRWLGVVITSGDTAECDVVSVLEITGEGCQQTTASLHTLGMFSTTEGVDEDDTNIRVISVPRQDFFAVLSGENEPDIDDKQMLCMKFSFRKGASGDPLSQAERNLLDVEGCRVFNYAQPAEVIPHPTKKWLLFTREYSDSEDAHIYERFDLAILFDVWEDTSEDSDAVSPDDDIPAEEPYNDDEPYYSAEDLEQEEEEGDDELCDTSSPYDQVD
eukprot:TRINITY_DN2597_c0_g1_i8.p1 TRINITY_DN2597_c0_g1~~TRINITY_DN2597_c0_g1_i8.p1  ORF type:complete len:337 (+),score=38.22 TRINITY_DN2597_c0_g1_i8:131-1141(+)